MFGLLRSARTMASRTLGNSIGNGIENEWGSPKLWNLAQQLRFYQPPHAPWCSDDDADESGEGGGGGVSSHLGVLESVAVSSNSNLSVARKRAKRAAVLVCLFEGSEGDLRVILTQRSGNLSSHSERRRNYGDSYGQGSIDCGYGETRLAQRTIKWMGGPSHMASHDHSCQEDPHQAFIDINLHSSAQSHGEVALPGGKMEERDKDDSETALREAKEEIGLDPSHVKVVTTLEPFLSKYLLRVVPVVGLLPDRKSFRPVINPGEVDAIFDAPLEMFLKDENYRSEEKQWMGFNYTVHYFDFQTEHKKFLIWGLTASILIRAASVIYQRPPSFPEVVPDFGGIENANSGHDPKL